MYEHENVLAKWQGDDEMTWLTDNILVSLKYGIRYIDSASKTKYYNPFLSTRKSIEIHSLSFHYT